MIRSPVLFLPRSKRIDFNFRSYTWYSIHQYTIHSYLLQNSPSFAEKRLFIWTHLPITQGHSQKLGTVFSRRKSTLTGSMLDLEKTCLGGSQNAWFIRENPSINGWWLGIPPISGNLQMGWPIRYLDQNHGCTSACDALYEPCRDWFFAWKTHLLIVECGRPGCGNGVLTLDMLGLLLLIFIILWGSMFLHRCPPQSAEPRPKTKASPMSGG